MLPPQLSDLGLQPLRCHLLRLDQVKVSCQPLQLPMLALLLQSSLLLLQTQLPLQALQLRAQLLLLCAVPVLKLLSHQV